MMIPRYLKAVGFAVALLVLATAFPTPAKADLSFSVSYSNLSPYGSWHVSSQYGRVWRPRIAVGEWHPYYDGHWVYTDLGWTWVSDYPWGSIPYHYGTWVIEPGIGWVWLPGRVWAPSWVVFCDGPDYIGWAPVPPRYSVGVSVNFRDIGYNNFVMVRSRDFMSSRIRNYSLPRSRTNVIINNTRIVNRISIQNNIVINRGPDVRNIERHSGRRLRATPIERVNRVAPFERFNRDQIRMRPDGGRRGARATEPVSSQTPLPGRDRDRDDRYRDRDGDRDRDRDRRDDDGRRSESYRQPSSPRMTPSQQSERERRADVDRRRDDDRQRPTAPRSATTQRRSYPEGSPSARGPARRDERRPEPSASPTRKKAPVKQQPAKRKRPPKDEDDDTY